MPSPFDLISFAARLEAAGRDLARAEGWVLEEAGRLIKAEAQSAIGTYRYGWRELAPATQRQRVHLGFSANEPLLRTGELRASIGYEVDRNDRSVTVGSPMKIAAFQELGTRSIPPRPFLRPAATKAGPVVAKLAAAEIRAALAGRGPASREVHELLEALKFAWDSLRDLADAVSPDEKSR